MIQNYISIFLISEEGGRRESEKELQCCWLCRWRGDCDPGDTGGRLWKLEKAGKQISFLGFHKGNQPYLPLDFRYVCELGCICLFMTLWTVAARLLCPWDFPGKNTGAGCHFLLQSLACIKLTFVLCPWTFRLLPCPCEIVHSDIMNVGLRVSF